MESPLTLNPKNKRPIIFEIAIHICFSRKHYIGITTAWFAARWPPNVMIGFIDKFHAFRTHTALRHMLFVTHFEMTRDAEMANIILANSFRLPFPHSEYILTEITHNRGGLRLGAGGGGLGESEVDMRRKQHFAQM